jgi:hypothetical protein
MAVNDGLRSPNDGADLAECQPFHIVQEGDEHGGF